jgi:hypothetical protein
MHFIKLIHSSELKFVSPFYLPTYWGRICNDVVKHTLNTLDIVVMDFWI